MDNNAIQFEINGYLIKVPIVDTPTIKSITPILRKVFTEYSKETPLQILIKDYDVYIDDALLNLDDLVKNSVNNGFNRCIELCKDRALISKDDTSLDDKAKQQLFSNETFLNDFKGNVLFFFALQRYVGIEVLKGLDTPLIVPYL